jgi:antitoxin CcdA
MSTADRRSKNVSLPVRLVDEARSLGINLSRACESGVEAALKPERLRRWKAENADAIAAYNRWVEEHGVPLEEFRQF